jgi:hypothetical protein
LHLLMLIRRDSGGRDERQEKPMSLTVNDFLYLPLLLIRLNLKK